MEPQNEKPIPFFSNYSYIGTTRHDIIIFSKKNKKIVPKEWLNEKTYYYNLRNPEDGADDFYSSAHCGKKSKYIYKQDIKKILSIIYE